MRRFLTLLVLVLAACSRSATPVVTPTSNSTHATSTVNPPPSPPTQRLEPHEQYTIDYLRERSYGGGQIEVVKVLTETDAFTSYEFRYPSDGLTIYGFVNVPKGKGPFPVIVSVHGYAPRGSYDPFNVRADHADTLAANGFVVFHPGLRNQPPSDEGDNLLRVGMSIDVLNLIALLNTPAEFPAELADADPDRLGLWGNSMGGEIALRVLTISPDIKATVLLSTLSGDSLRNSAHIYDVVRDEEFRLDEQIPQHLHDRISSINYYSDITSAIQLHHGTADETAPIKWAVETCDFLKAAGISIECVYYEGVDHVLTGDAAEMMLQSALAFYQIQLSP